MNWTAVFVQIAQRDDLKDTVVCWHTSDIQCETDRNNACVLTNIWPTSETRQHVAHLERTAN